MQNKDDGEKVVQTQTPFPSSGASKKPGIFKKILILIASIAVVVLVIAGVLYGLGVLKLGLQIGSVGVGAVRTITCDYGIVSEYNTILSASATTDEEVAAVTTKLTQLVKTIQEDNQYATDPTCLYISYSVAFRTGDMTAATGYVDKIDTLAKEDAFIDSRLNGPQSISQMRMLIEGEKNAESRSALGSG